MRPIPFLDLKTLNQSIAPEIFEAIQRVIEHGQFIAGPEVKIFENQWANYCDAGAAVGCANGTASLHAALHALKIGPGMEVILPSHTFVATAEAVRLTGATPVFAEIDKGTMLLDASRVSQYFTQRTAAIIPVHLYGMPADMDGIAMAVAARNLPIIADAAQAHGAIYKGRQIGAFGTAASFSFFPGKNLGAFGDAGAVTTNDAELARRVRLFVNHGRETKYEHLVMGTNYRLDTIQAAILTVKLRHLDTWVLRRRKLARLYREILSLEPFSSHPVLLQDAPAGAESSYHLFVVRAEKRAAIVDGLKKRGIPTGLHYPIPCHLQPSMSDISPGPGYLLTTERVADSVISLPMCPTMTEGEVERVCDIFRAVLVHLKASV